MKKIPTFEEMTTYEKLRFILKTLYYYTQEMCENGDEIDMLEVGGVSLYYNEITDKVCLSDTTDFEELPKEMQDYILNKFISINPSDFQLYPFYIARGVAKSIGLRFKEINSSFPYEVFCDDFGSEVIFELVWKIFQTSENININDYIKLLNIALSGNRFINN